MSTKKEFYPYIIGLYTHPGNKQKSDLCEKVLLHGGMPENSLLLKIHAKGESQPPEIVGNTLFLDYTEAYENLPTKTYAWIQYCVEHFDFRYLIKIDDDVLVSTLEQLVSTLRGDYVGISKTKPSNRLWHVGKTKAEDLSLRQYEGTFPDKYNCGPMYFISNDFAKVIAATPEHTIEDITLPVGYEDIMIGKLAADNDVKPTPISKLHSFIETASLNQMRFLSRVFLMPRWCRWPFIWPLATLFTLSNALMCPENRFWRHSQ